MPDNFHDSRTYRHKELNVDFRFKTSSDAKLASLLLDYDFPIHLFKQVVDLILDPEFSLQDVTLKGFWEVFEVVSERRRELALERDSLARRRTVDDELTTLATTTSNVPPVAIDLVVNRMLEDDIPLGVAAMQPSWKGAFACIGADFRNMSLVHRSWTSIAQSGLRRRAVVPYQHIERFLLSPLCGPWVRELIVYWKVVDVGIVESDLLLLEALLRRTPNVHSLSFNTSLVWPSECDCPPLHVDKCLDILSARLPRLENLWLKHFRPPYDVPEAQVFLPACNAMPSLCAHIPKLRSLQFLSLRSWTSSWQDEDESSVDWNEHPPCRLKSIELDLDSDSNARGLHKKELLWLIKPRDDFRLESLSIVDRMQQLGELSSRALQDALTACLPGILDLRLCLIDACDDVLVTTWPRWSRLLGHCKNLSNFELFMLEECELDCFRHSDLPSSLKRFVIHCHDKNLRDLSSSPKFASLFFSEVKSALPQLPLLRNILMTGSPRLSKETIRNWHLDAFVHHMNKTATPLESTFTEFIELFKEKHNIELSLITNAFPRDWNISNYNYYD